jgi:hypothetical protein
MNFRQQLTLALLSNPGFFTHGLPTFHDPMEAAKWLDMEYNPNNLSQTLELSQTILASYLDSLVEKIITIGELDQ